MTNLDKKLVSRHFNRAAAGYEQAAVLQKTVSRRLLSRLELLKVSPEWIIDAGSGTGATARALAHRYRRARVVQIDLSPCMLVEARQHDRVLFNRQHYVCADIENLPVASRSVQLVFSSLAYQWCNDLDRAFQDASRVLEANGLFLFATLGPDTLQELRECWAVVDDMTHVHTFYDMHDIGDALVRSGMENVVMDAETITMRYPDCISLMRDLRRTGAQNANLDRHNGLTGRKRMQALQEAYEQFRQEDTLPATYEIVYGHGWIPESPGHTNQEGETRIPVSAIGGRQADTRKA